MTRARLRSVILSFGQWGDLALTSATPLLATRNQGTKGDLSGCVRPRDSLSCGATTDVGGPGQFRGLSFGEIGIPFRASGRGFPARAELCLGLLQGGRADPAKITIRVMAITSLETRLP